MDAEYISKDDMAQALDDVQMRDEAEAFKKSKLYQHVSAVVEEDIEDATQELIRSTDPQKDIRLKSTIMGLRLFGNLLNEIIANGNSAAIILRSIEDNSEKQY